MKECQNQVQFGKIIRKQQPKPEEVYQFLALIDGDFPVPVSEKTDLLAYAEKLCAMADIFCAADEKGIYAMMAGYTNNPELAYMAIAGVRPDKRGQGWGTAVAVAFLNLCRQKGIRRVHLYAKEENVAAVKIYEGLHFRVWDDCPDEPRPDDYHMICELEG